MNFIAGYQEGSIRDEKLLAKRIGAVLIAFGLECLAVFLVHRFVVPLNSVYIGILAIIHVFIILLLFIKHRLNSL
ncbi:hypothetical protein AC622_14440 [Bacillus sp. FJAT-27916]|nr:hypothetical protein AC622_14440 [Bacillus sp. FJAT-27916]